MIPRNDDFSFSSMIRWAYWPPTPRERSPLYVTAIVLLAAALVDHFSRLSTGAAAYFVFWPLSYILAAPLVRIVSYVSTKNDPIFHAGPLRRTVFIVASVLWAIAALAYIITPAIDALDFILCFVTPLSAVLLLGVPIVAAMLTGAQPGTPNYVSEAHEWVNQVRAWLGTFPLSSTHQPQGPDPDEWIDPNAEPTQDNTQNTQDIPRDEPPPPPELHTYPWACQVLDVSGTATYEYIQAAYRQLANDYHPDRATNPRDAVEREEAMTRINVAWGIIKSHHQNRA